MFLPTFDLKELIKQENEKSGSQHELDENFGFHYFDKELIALLNNQIDLINSNEFMYVFSSEEGTFQKYANKNFSTAKNNLPTIITKGRSSSKKPSIFTNQIPNTENEIERLNQSIAKKYAWLHWAKTQVVILNKQSTWVEHKDFTDIESLKNWWDSQVALAHWTDTAIYKMASKTLPWLVKQHKKALKLLISNNHNIPPFIYNEYLNYIKKFLASCKQLEKMLANSMLARLQALDYPNNKHGFTSPIVLISKQLKIPGTIKKQPFQVKEKEINYFHHYIEQNGSSSAKKDLHKISWFKKQDSFPTTTLNSARYGTLLVPAEVIDFVPSEEKWPNWLFSGHNFRHAFFKDHIFLIATLKKQSSMLPFIDYQDEKSYQPLIKQLATIEEMLNASLDKAHRAQKKLSWYSFPTKTFLKKWQTTINSQKVKIIEKKLYIAEQLAKGLDVQNSDTSTVKNLSWQACKDLFDLSCVLQAEVNNEKLNASLRARIRNIKNASARLETVSKFVELISKLAKGTIISQAEKDYLASYIERTSQKDNSFIQQARSICKAQIESILENCREELKKDPFTFRSNAELESHQRKIVCYLCIAKRIGSEEELHTIQEQAQKYFLRYLQNILTKQSLDYENANITAQAVLGGIGELAKWGDQPLINHINELQTLKAQPLLFNIKCKGLIIAMGNKFLEKRFNKELNRFDMSLFQTLKKEPFNYDDLTIQEIVKIRDEIINTDKTLLEIATTPSQKSICGLNDENSPIPQLINLSIMPRKAEQNFKKECQPLNVRPLVIKELHRNIMQYFTNVNGQTFFKSINNKKWFAKIYIDENILKGCISKNNNRI